MKTLRCGRHALELSRPRVMGILNVTADSFADGGRFDDFDRALAHARQMRADGADIIDVGGESTRPHALPMDAATELARVIPLVDLDAAGNFQQFIRRAFARGRLRDAAAPLVLKRVGNRLGFDPRAAPRELDVHQWAALYGTVSGREAVHSEK